MSSEHRSEARAEAAEVFRWILLFPTFAVLALLSANFTLGFVEWISHLQGTYLYVMIPVGILVVLSNALASFVSCMIAPRKRSATILLGVGHLVGMIWGYYQFDWPLLTAIGLIAHGVMVYAGLAAVYYLDRLHFRELAREAGESANAASTEGTTA
jgi:hypothetical protein